MTFHVDPSINEGSAQDFADATEDFLNAIDIYLNTSISFRGFDYVESFDSVSGDVSGQEAVTPFTVAGDNSATVLPPVTQALIKWSTGVWVNGRQLVGKTYVPGLCEDSNEPGGVLQTGVATAFYTAANAFATAAGLVVWSRTHGVRHPVSVATVSTKWAYLSGRRDG
jgi:hypothetical protein